MKINKECQCRSFFKSHRKTILYSESNIRNNIRLRAILNNTQGNEMRVPSLSEQSINAQTDSSAFQKVMVFFESMYSTVIIEKLLEYKSSGSGLENRD
jgi:hypothetical protein